MMKKLKASLIVLVSLLGVSSLQAGTITKVNLNGQKIFMSELPTVKNGTTYVDVTSLEKALGVEISNSVKTMPVREVANKVGAKLEFDKSTNTVNLTYQLKGETDLFGRLIRSTNLPKNAKEYKYILSSVPNALYEGKLRYEKMDWSIKPVEGDHFIRPKNMDTLDYFTAENINNWVSRLEKNLDLRLNVSYKTVNSNWANELVETYPTSHKDSYVVDIKEYMSYIKNNNIEVVGDYYVEPSTFYSCNGTYVRVYVKFKISSNKVKEASLYQQYDYKIKTNTWYEGYADLSIGTNVYNSSMQELWVDYDTITLNVKACGK